jgi:hypothetical protein
LSFDQLGTATHVTTEPVPVPTTPTDIAAVAAVGVRTFAQVNSSLSLLTGVPTTEPDVMATYLMVQQQLPAVSTLESFSAANQVGIAQLAIQYCNVAVNTPSLQAALFPAGISSTQFTTQAGIDSVTSALAARVLGTGLSSQPAPSTVSTELSGLIGKLCATNSCTTTKGTLAVAAAACAAALGSSNMLIN